MWNENSNITTKVHGVMHISYKRIFIFKHNIELTRAWTNIVRYVLSTLHEVISSVLIFLQYFVKIFNIKTSNMPFAHCLRFRWNQEWKRLLVRSVTLSSVIRNDKWTVVSYYLFVWKEICFKMALIWDLRLENMF